VAPYVETRPADWLLLAVLRPAWAYRVELFLIVLLAVVYVRLGGTLGRDDTDRVIVAAAFVVALVGWTREPLARSLARRPYPATVGAGLPTCRAGLPQ
jgi:hypothetical protein